MTSTVKDRLILAAAELGQTEVGQKFIAAFTPFVEEARDSAIEAPPEWIHQMQGSARGLSLMLRILRTAPEEAQKVVTKLDAKAQRNKP